jgi:predicted branched-subunit amino acid permease
MFGINRYNYPVFLFAAAFVAYLVWHYANRPAEDIAAVALVAAAAVVLTLALVAGLALGSLAVMLCKHAHCLVRSFLARR